MNPTAKFILNLFSILLAAFLLIPSAAIVASWNALPGDTLYSTKRTLEKVALAIISPNYKASSTLQTKLIARRADEATNTIIKKSSSKGLEELRQQMQTIRAQINAAPTQEEKQIVAKQAVTELKKTQTKLKKTRTSLAQNPSSPTIIHTTTNQVTVIQQEIIKYLPAPTTPTPSSTPQPSPSPEASPTETTPESEEDLIGEITNTEQEIEEVIGDIEEQASIESPPAETTPTTQESNHGRSFEHRRDNQQP